MLSNYDSLPTGITHKQLKRLFASAQRESESSNQETISTETDKFNEMLLNWSSLTKELLTTLSNKKSHLLESKSPKSLMALGAFETHLQMAIHAKDAYEKQG